MNAFWCFFCVWMVFGLFSMVVSDFQFCFRFLWFLDGFCVFVIGWYLDGFWWFLGGFHWFWWFNGCIVQTVFSQKYFFKVYFSKVYGPKLFGFEVSSGSGSGRTWWPGLHFLLLMCYEFLQIRKLPRKMQIFAYQSSTNPSAILSQMAWPDNWKAITGEMEMREIMLVQTLISPIMAPTFDCAHLKSAPSAKQRRRQSKK